MNDLGVLEEASREQCIAESGMSLAGTSLVNVERTPGVVRSRLVARDFKRKGDGCRVEMSAAMPLWEAKRFLFRMVAGLVCQPQADYVMIPI